MKCDLPVHCLAKNIAGSWTFFLTPFQSSYPSCAHRHPDQNTDHLSNDFKTTFRLNETMKVNLNLPNILQDSQGVNVGTWTMVYDEGFEIRASNRILFAFSKYRFDGVKAPTDKDDEETKGYYSFCNETFQGWVRDPTNDYWGCFYGEKNGKYQADSIFEKKFLKTSDSNEDNKIVERRDLMVTTKNDDNNEGNGPINSQNDYYDNMRLYERFQQNEQLYEVPHAEYLQDPNIELQQAFVPDYRFIEYINDDKIKSPWKAKFHESIMSNKTHKEMKQLLGLTEYKSYKYRMSFLQASEKYSVEKPSHRKFLKKSQNYQKPFSFSQESSQEPLDLCGHSNSEIPRCFDWRSYESTNYDTPIKRQGDCGSCYALSTLSMIEARIRVKSRFKYKPYLSSGGTLSCTYYNQGCNGGYPFLVAKEGAERGYIEESCSPLISDQRCEESCFQGKVWKVSDYGYVGGGFYGSTNDKAMMKEIYQNGPVVVALNASPDLYYYSTGVFITNPTKNLKQSNERDDIKPWMYTNHAVVCVGWGEAEHEGNLLKYWVLKNSWGEDWGEKGYFKFLRGKNLAGIENQAVFANPIID